jgi:hypothetical protein
MLRIRQHLHMCLQHDAMQADHTSAQCCCKLVSSRPRRSSSYLLARKSLQRVVCRWLAIVDESPMLSLAVTCTTVCITCIHAQPSGASRNLLGSVQSMLNAATAARCTCWPSCKRGHICCLCGCTSAEHNPLGWHQYSCAVSAACGWLQAQLNLNAAAACAS